MHTYSVTEIGSWIKLYMKFLFKISSSILRITIFPFSASMDSMLKKYCIHVFFVTVANFKLPEVCDVFNEVIFTELPKEKAEELVRKYNEEGIGAVGPPGKRFRTNDQQSRGRGGRNSS